MRSDVTGVLKCIEVELVGHVVHIGLYFHLFVTTVTTNVSRVSDFVLPNAACCEDPRCVCTQSRTLLPGAIRAGKCTDGKN